jgi:predicted small lipoprotein YifL
MKILKGFIWLIILLVALAMCGLLYLRSCEWNPEKAAEYVTKNAENKSVGLCAKYVRKAIVAGGIPLYQGGDAWSYK